jgi:hypothetical protein
MGGGGTQTSTQSTTPNNPAVDATTTKLLTGLQAQYDKGSSVFGQSLQPGAGDTTQQSWASMLGAANNPDYSTAIKDTMKSQGAIASGQNISDPTYDRVRSGAIDDSIQAGNSSFLTDGRFGSTVHGGAIGEGVGKAVAGLDYARQQQAIQNLPGLYQASLAPAGVQAGVGAAQDANALALRQGEADLFDRTHNKGWNDLARATSILAGNAGASGSTTTTTTPETPWWQQVLGGGAIASGIYKNVWGS